MRFNHKLALIRDYKQSICKKERTKIRLKLLPMTLPVKEILRIFGCSRGMGVSDGFSAIERNYNISFFKVDYNKYIFLPSNKLEALEKETIKKKFEELSKLENLKKLRLLQKERSGENYKAVVKYFKNLCKQFYIEWDGEDIEDLKIKLEKRGVLRRIDKNKEE